MSSPTTHALPTLTRAVKHPFSRLVLSLLLCNYTIDALWRLERLVLPRLREETALAFQVSVLRAVGTLLALLVVGRWLEGRGPAQLGLDTRGALQQWGRGMLLGTGLITAVVGVLAVPGWYQVVDVVPRGALETATGAFTWAAIFTFAALWEEVIYRGLLFRLLEEWIGSGVALLLSSLLFGLMHFGNPNATRLATLAIALEGGLLLAGCYMLTRSLWFVTGVHFAWNWVQGAVLGVAVSGNPVPGLLQARLVGPETWTGGSFGVEGGGVAVLLVSAAGVGLVVRAARRGQWRAFLARRRELRALAAAEARPSIQEAPAT
ncbi:hypothetical protein BO221_01695 [Archangium sp. Cb G35]|uniref:CPBP family intramembrane glutamic endopeptidase n=1 Tax=Archangium sp. Cb G35 TaxID=1920190 RepID=UPI000936D74E|nr:CPBP family intramembrane glutamic endopeptidase [Archangium sp. Cb G35]OJT26764.1 hypothetical protein BO221_01695 [Archangium sp. Cb G35]